MNNQQEEVFRLLPRHIRKLLQHQQALPSAQAPQQEGWLDMSSSVSVWGTIGTDEVYNKYPDPKSVKLRNELAEYVGLPADCICVGNGSTELIDLALRVFCTPTEDEVLCFAPVESRLKHFAQLQALEINELPLEPDYQLPIYNIPKQINNSTKVIFIENPNAITGTLVSSFDIVDIVSDFDGVVIVDESAIDYAPSHSLVSLVEQCDNLLVVQSFSGIWGLAALRVGMIYAQPAIIEVLQALKPAFSVNAIAQRQATSALYVADQKERVVQKMTQQREQLRESLQNLKIIKKVHESETNTLLVEVEHASELVEYLRKEEYIAIKDVSHLVGTENCVRISVGQGLDNVRLLKALKDMTYKQSPTRKFLKMVSKTLRKASSFFGFFKKIIGT